MVSNDSVLACCARRLSETCHERETPMDELGGARGEGRSRKMRALPIVALLAGLTCAAPARVAELTRDERVVIEYVEPKDRAFKETRDLLMSNRVLEAARDVLAPVRWPRTIRLELRDCDGEPNAWYGEGTVTVCYEYVDEMLGERVLVEETCCNLSRRRL